MRASVVTFMVALTEPFPKNNAAPGPLIKTEDGPWVLLTVELPTAIVFEDLSNVNPAIAFPLPESLKYIYVLDPSTWINPVAPVFPVGPVAPVFPVGPVAPLVPLVPASPALRNSRTTNSASDGNVPDMYATVNWVHPTESAIAETENMQYVTSLFVLLLTIKWPFTALFEPDQVFT